MLRWLYIAQKDIQGAVSKLTQVDEDEVLDDEELNLTFNFNKNKKYTAEWIKEEEKKIFEVMV